MLLYQFTTSWSSEYILFLEKGCNWQGLRIFAYNYTLWTYSNESKLRQIDPVPSRLVYLEACLISSSVY